MITTLDILKRYAPFSSLEETILQGLEKNIIKLRKKNKEKLELRKNHIYLIVSGRVAEVAFNEDENVKFYLNHHSQGETLGLFYTDNDFQCRSTCEIFEIYLPTWKAHFQEHRLNLLESQLNKIKSKVCDLAFLTIEERVVKGYKRGEFDKCSKQEVAYHVGGSREMVSRVCTKLELKVGHGKSSDLSDEEIDRLPRQVG